MTIIVANYSDFERRLIGAAYVVSNRLDKNSVSIAEINQHFDILINDRWLRTALKEFGDQGWSKEALHSGSREAQRIWLSADGLRQAERIIQSDGLLSLFPREEATSVAVDSATWTGLPSTWEISEESRQKLRTAIDDASSIIDSAKLSNEQKDQALAYVTAAKILAETPSPPADMIWQLMSRANNIFGIAAFFVALAGLIK